MKSIFLLVYSFLCEILVLFLILATPSVESPIFLGLSLPRLIIFMFVLFCTLISAGMLFISISHKWFYPTLSKFFESFPEAVSNSLFLLALFSIGFLILSFTAIFPNQPFMDKLRPLLLLFSLLSSGGCIHDIFICRHQPWITSRFAIVNFGEKVKNLLVKIMEGNHYIMIALFLTFPLIFTTAITFSFPSGFAGLYTLMSEEIGNSGFGLPTSVPFYGPGGIPFAYPPASFYLMAFFSHIIDIPTFIYLRFAPAIFMWLSMIPLTLLTFKFTKSKIAAILTTLLVSGNQHIFLLQGASGGIVRGLAFLLALWAIYFFIIAALDKNKKKYAILSGIFIGLTVLTHLSYAQFVILFVIAYLVSHFFSKQIWKLSLTTGLVTLSISAPWVIMMVHRYGWIVFQGALQSHRNDNFLQLWNNPNQIIPWIENSLNPIMTTPLICGLIIFALVYAIFSKKKVLLVWFALILLITSESDRYLFVIGAILISNLFSVLFSSLRQSADTIGISWRSILFMISLVIIFFQTGMNTINSSNQPLINDDSLEMAEYIQENTSKEAIYLLVASPEEAEWFPYLLQRVPAAASWGGEWIGTYTQNSLWVHEIHYCKEDQSVTCIENVIAELPLKPDLLITHIEDIDLNKELETSLTWKKSYGNSSMILWLKN